MEAVLFGEDVGSSARGNVFVGTGLGCVWTVINVVSELRARRTGIPS